MMPPRSLCCAIAATTLAFLAPAARGEEPATFPVSVDGSGRFLRDDSGRPFLIQGEAAWSLMTSLSREEVELYLKDRSARGFNTLVVSLIEHKFAPQAPKTIYGDAPFIRDGDFTAPNEDYFAHADWVLERTADYGFLVLLAPAYAGTRGGDEGWYREMETCGAECLRTYGRFLGKRYGSHKNIVWMQGGDYDPPDKDLVRAIAGGIAEVAPGALQTAHCAPETAALDYWGGETWLKINTIYTYSPVIHAARAQARREERMPFVLVESAYENEHGAGELRVRAQAYQALLTGAAGQVFGNNPIWHFSAPGIHSAPVGWRQALSSRGTQSMSHLTKLFADLRWWKLAPDLEHALLIQGAGGSDQRAAAAVTDDRTLAVVYVPTVRTITLNLSLLQGTHTIARWFDPSEGTFASQTERLATDFRRRRFSPPGPNASGLGDWVLVLTSETERSTGDSIQAR